MAATRLQNRKGDNSLLGVVFRLLYFAFVLTIVVLEFPGIDEKANSPDPGIFLRDLVIPAVREDGPNSDKNIKPGDVIYSVGGERIRNRFHYASIVAANDSFEPLEYILLRDDSRVHVNVEFGTIPNIRLVHSFSLVLLALAFLFVGTWVYLRRPDFLGSLFALNCAMLAFFFTHRPSVTDPMLMLMSELTHDAIMLFFPALFLHFFLVFPDGQRDGSSSERMWRLVAVYSVPTALYIVSAFVMANRFNFRAVDESLLSGIMAASTLYFGSYIVASLVLFVRSYRSSPRAQKQKLRVVTVGTLVGIVPFVSTLVSRQFVSGEDYFLEFASVLCLGLVPTTFAYAILKHGAIELNRVVRNGLVYAALTGTIVALYYVVVASVGDFVLKELNVARYVFMPFAVLVLAITFAPARDCVQRFVDRFFFRGEYVYRKEVFDFNRQLARKLKREEIFDCFVERVDGLLKSSFIAVYTRDGDQDLELARTVGDCPDVPKRFSMQSFLGGYFSRYPTPLMVEFLDDSWERRNLDESSRYFLEFPGLAVCAPVVAHDRLLSLIILGEKRSGLVYNGTDTDLLATFSEQLALALQNAELLESSIEQERLLNEVMLARDIQLSLLPTSPPKNPKIDIFGSMVSSFEVGGDYFDYFFIDDDRIALAIGDFSGKGIPAAMLMSSLQAVFRNLAIKGGLPPAEVNTELNEYLATRANAEQFASFFYGVFDLRRSRFVFSNAGHCPALLVKDNYVDRLGQGGMLLGVSDSVSYRDGSVLVEPGDLITLYTDGITEQKNRQGEEYGEARLIEFLTANKNLPVERMQSTLLDDVMSFGDGLQQDDITCVFAYNKTT